MPSYSPVTASPGNVLTASDIVQLQSNITEVRIHHLGSNPPDLIEPGIIWLDNTDPAAWALKIRDNSDWITLLTINTLANTAWVPLSGIGEGHGQFPATDRTATEMRWSGPLHTPRNMLINGGFRIWQRGAEFYEPVSGTCLADRWLWRGGPNGTVHVRRGGTRLAMSQLPTLELEVLQEDGAMNANDYYGIEQVIEGSLAQRMLAQNRNGTALDVALGGFIYSSVGGTMCVAFQNADRSMSLVGELELDVGWNRFNFSFDGPLSGQWFVDHREGVRVSFCLGAGSDFIGGADSWTGSDIRATSSQTNFIALKPIKIAFSELQLELGTYAMPFEIVPIEYELAACERYYRKTFPADVAPDNDQGLSGALFAQSNGRALVNWRGRMRATPVVNVYSPGNSAIGGWWSVDASQHVNGLEYVSIDAETVVINTGDEDLPGTAGQVLAIHVTADAEYS